MSENNRPWNPADCVEWVYERKEGDIVIYARNQKEAISTMADHGFNNIDSKKLKRGQRELTDILNQNRDNREGR